MPKIIKSRAKLEEAFPDRSFTKEELRKFSKAVREAGGRDKWLIKKGFVSADEKGNITAVRTFEGIIGKEVIKGIGIRYSSDIPYSFWADIAFPQLEKYEFGLNKGKKENDENLDEFVSNLKESKQIKGMFEE